MLLVEYGCPVQGTRRLNCYSYPGAPGAVPGGAAAAVQLCAKAAVPRRAPGELCPGAAPGVCQRAPALLLLGAQNHDHLRDRSGMLHLHQVCLQQCSEAGKIQF